MPYTLAVTPPKRRACLVFEGPLVGYECLDAIDAVWSHPDWHPGHAVVCDFRAVTALKLSYDDLLGLATLLALHQETPRGPLVLLVANRLIHATARLFAALIRYRRPGAVYVCHHPDEVAAVLRQEPTVAVDPASRPASTWPSPPTSRPPSDHLPIA